MLRIGLRLGWLAVAANGAFIIWVARYGALWQYTADASWFQLYALRPGMYVIGAGSVVAGLYHALAWQTRWLDTACDVVDLRLAYYAPRLWTWLHREEIARGDWLPGDNAMRDYMMQPEPTRADLLRAQAGRCSEAGFPDMAAKLREEAEELDGGVLSPEEHDREVYGEPGPRSPRFPPGDDHYPGLVPVPVEGCDCSRCEYLRALMRCDKEC